MASDKPERDSVEAAFEAKIAAWTTALESYRAAKALDAPLSDLPVGALGSGRAMDLPVGVFRDKSLKEAIPIYLGAGRRKQTNKEIAEGLKAGGFPTTAENFEATVATALYRLKTDGIILRFPDGWDVASSYPDSLRSRLEKDSSSRKPNAARPQRRTANQGSRRRTKSNAKGKPATDAKTARRRKEPGQPGLEQRITAYLQTRAAEYTMVQELVTQLKAAAPVINLCLGKLVKAGRVEKATDGRVRLAKKAA